MSSQDRSDDFTRPTSEVEDDDENEEREDGEKEDDNLPQDVLPPLPPLPRLGPVAHQPLAGLFTVLTRQRKGGNLTIVKGTNIVHARKNESFLWSVVVPFPVDFAHAIVTVSRSGTLDRYGQFQADGGVSHRGVAMDRMVCLKSADSRILRSRAFKLKVVPQMIILGFGMVGLNLSGRGTGRRREVYEISATFAPFSPGDPSAPVPTPSSPVRCRNIVSKCLFCLRRTKSPVLMVVPAAGLRLNAALWDRGLPGGGDIVESTREEEVPPELRKLMRELSEEIETSGFGVFSERFVESGEENNEEEEGEIAALDPEERALIYGSDFASKTEEETAVAIPVSCPIVNATLRMNSKGERVVVLLSKNRGESWYNCHASLDDPTVDVTSSTTLFCDGNSIDGILRGPGITEDFVRAQMEVVRRSSGEFFQGFAVGKRIIGEGANGIVREATVILKEREKALGPDLSFSSFVCKRSRGGQSCDEQLLRELIVDRGRTICIASWDPSHFRDRVPQLFQQRYRRFPEFQENLVDRLLVVNDLTKELTDVHRMGYAHLDLKLDNILYSAPSPWDTFRWEKRKPHPVLVDFGLAVSWHCCINGVSPRGTPGYMPSRFDCDPRKIDMYAFGIVVWEYWTGQRAFAKERKKANDFVHRMTRDSLDLSPEDRLLIREIAVESFMKAIENQTPDLDCEECEEMPFELKSILRRCLSENPDERPTAEEFHSLMLTICHEPCASCCGEWPPEDDRRCLDCRRPIRHSWFEEAFDLEAKEKVEILIEEHLKRGLELPVSANSEGKNPSKEEQNV